MIQVEKYTLPDIIKPSFQRFGDKLALSDIDGIGLSYNELENKISSISNFLIEHGIAKGDRVAILAENQPNWGVAYLSATFIGAIAVPIMTEFKDADVHHILRHSGAKAIFISEKFLDKIAELENSDLETVVILEDMSIVSLEEGADIVSKVLKDGKKELNKIISAAKVFAGLSNYTPDENDLAAIVYTSGTTGHSKGVMLSHKNIVSDIIATLDLVNVTEGDRMLSILPLAHTMECTLGLLLPLVVGVTVYYLMKPPAAANLLPALKKVKPTVMVSVPLIIEKIYRMKILPEINKKKIVRSLYKFPPVRKKIHKAAGKKLLQTFGGSLKMYCIGGAALSEDTEIFLKESGFPYAIGYGLTETSPLVTGDDNTNTKLRAAGRPLKSVEIKIDNPDPENGEGEVLIKGPMVMQGYYKNPEVTKEVMTDDGYFRSGDLGILDKDGYLFIKGRSKNVIIGSNGKNIYPEEIESHINAMPFVLESLVHEREGKIIGRVHFNYDELDNEYKIHEKPQAEAQKIIQDLLDDILKTVNEKVPSFSKLSKIIEQPEEFEKTPTKKIKRYLYT